MWLVFVLVLPLYRTESSPSVPSPHQRLLRDALDQYDPLVRPVRNPEQTINVTIRISFYQLIDVNEVVQSVSIYCWIIEQWHDEFLYWNPEKYSGETIIVVKSDMVWKPDTTLYNDVSGDRARIENAIIEMKPRESLHRTSVKLQYPSIMQYSCNMFLLYFPFDVQNCSIELASWVYDTTSINYFTDSDSVHMDSFIQSSEWTVLSFRARRVTKKYSCCPNPYVSIYYHLVIRRKPLFYILNLIVPTIIISIIALFGFFFPSHSAGERKEKVSLGISTLLSMSVFLLMISDELPTTSDFVPFIGWFYMGIIFFIAIATLTTSVLIVVQQQGRYGRRINPRVKQIFFHTVAKYVILRPPIAILENHTLHTPRRKKNSFREHGHHMNTTNISLISYGVGSTQHVNGGSCDRLAVPQTVEPGGDMGLMTEGSRTPTFGVGLTVQRQSSTPSRKVSPAGDASALLNAAGQNKLYNELYQLHFSVQNVLKIRHECEEQASMELEWEWLASIIEQVVLTTLMTALLVFSLGILFTHQSVEEH